jgi:outer membrane immunogenic protein
VVGNFLPYAFVGLALGIADTSVSVTINGKEYTSGIVGFCPPSPVACPIQFPNPPTSSSGLNNAVLYGLTAGGGVDMAVTGDIFLRAEVEFDQFKPPPGFLMSVFTGRVGAGFKF